VNELATSDRASQAELDGLAELATDIVQRCRARGADEADVVASVDTGLSVNVRLGEVETIERARDRGVSVSVLFGKR
jgi:PmbA protein